MSTELTRLCLSTFTVCAIHYIMRGDQLAVIALQQGMLGRRACICDTICYLLGN